MMLPWLLALVLPFASAQQELPAEVRGALDRAATELPRGEADDWSEWQPSDVPPAELRPSLGNMSRAYGVGDLASSVLHLQRALALAPDYPPVVHQLGVVYFKLGRYGDAAECFERFLVVAPGEVGATRALGHAYYSLGRYEEARAHYERVLGGNPEQPDARWGLALAVLRLGDSDRALELLEAVLGAEPGHQEARLWRARVLYEEERTEEALPEALHAQELDPYDPEVWFLLARIHTELEAEEEAEQARARFDELTVIAQEVRRLEASLELDPRRTGALVQLARTHASAGDVKRTRSTLQRLLKVAPRDLQANLFALDLLVNLEDEGGAVIAARSLATNCAEEPEAWYRLERYYGRLRDRERQIQAGARARRLENERKASDGEGDS